MTRICFIRHGVTDWNIEKRIQGQTDVPLNAIGIQQAKALSNRIKYEKWDLIYSSDLTRAKVTADIVAGPLGLQVHTDPRLREMYCGDLEGTTLDERIQRWGEDWRNLSLGVEDDESIAERGMAFVEDIAEKHRGKNILVVSHGALIRKTIKKMIPHKDTTEPLHNTSVTIVIRNDIQWECELYNCIQHLN